MSHDALSTKVRLISPHHSGSVEDGNVQNSVIGNSINVPFTETNAFSVELRNSEGILISHRWLSAETVSERFEIFPSDCEYSPGTYSLRLVSNGTCIDHVVHLYGDNEPQDPN